MTLGDLKLKVKNERNKTMGVKQIEQLNMGKILELQSSERKLVNAYIKGIIDSKNRE